MTAAPLEAPARPSAAMALLGSGVPLSLLLDLAYGPRSEELLAVELLARLHESPPAA